MASKRTTGTAVATWDEELARRAQLAAEAEANAGGGQFFSFRGGRLSFNGSELHNNEVAVVVCAAIFENVYYEGRFDPDQPAPPTCYAFATQESELAPHKIVQEAGNAQHDQCKGCDQNEWGTADTGKGKACRNTRRLAVLPCGIFHPTTHAFEPYEPEQLEAAAFGFMKLPVTSVQGYAAYVKSIANGLKKPLETIFTRVSVEPDPKSQFKVKFNAIKEVPPNLIPILLKRADEAAELIQFPYPPPGAYEEAAPAKSRDGRRAQKPPARQRR